jgi:hypothetical protein
MEYHMNILIEPTNASASAPDIRRYAVRDAGFNHYQHHADGTRFNERVSSYVEHIVPAKAGVAVPVRDNTRFSVVRYGSLLNRRSVENGPSGVRVILNEFHDNGVTASHFRYNKSNQLIESNKFSYNNDNQLIESHRYNYNNGKLNEHIQSQYHDNGKLSNELVSSYYSDGRLNYQDETAFRLSGKKDTRNFIEANYDSSGNHLGYSGQHTQFGLAECISDYKTVSYDTQGHQLPAMTISNNPLGNVIDDTTSLITAINNFPGKVSENMYPVEYAQKSMTNVFAQVSYASVLFTEFS